MGTASDGRDKEYAGVHLWAQFFLELYGFKAASSPPWKVPIPLSDGERRALLTLAYLRERGLLGMGGAS